MTALVPINDEFSNALLELEQTQKMCSALMKMPHYARIGDVGIFTIVQKAKSIGLSPLDALNGGMYFVNGKVELSANTMNYMIRQKGHSITKDPKSNDEICILHGRRIDNGDTWTSSFSIKEAKQAGIFKNTWEKYPARMLFARALSILARELFPDVTRGTYVEGEISQAIESDKNDQYKSVKSQCNYEVIDKPVTIETYIPKITQDQCTELNLILEMCDPKYVEKLVKQLALKHPPIKCLEDLTIDLYDEIKKFAESARDNYQKRIKKYQEAKDGEVVIGETDNV